MFQAAGVLLILSFVSFAVGGSLPLVGEKGNPRFFNLPEPEYLANVVSNAKVWRWANAFMGAAVVILLAGLTILATILEGANELILSRLGLVLFLPAAVLWVIFSAYCAGGNRIGRYVQYSTVKRRASWSPGFSDEM